MTFVFMTAAVATIIYLFYQIWPKEETARQRIARRANDARCVTRIKGASIWSDNGRL